MSARRLDTESSDVPDARPPGVVAALADAQMRGVRWLADRLLPHGELGLRDLPAPSSVRVQLSRSRMVRDYVVGFARHPDAGGSFEARTRWMRWLPGPLLVRMLTALGYDGLVYVRGGTVIGHVFYQRHGDTLHAVSTAVDEAFEGRRYWRVMVLDYVAYAAQRPDIVGTRLGRKRNALARPLLRRLKDHEEQLGWRVHPDGWVRFSRT